MVARASGGEDSAKTTPKRVNLRCTHIERKGRVGRQTQYAGGIVAQPQP
jgi:hypothetical protein